MNAGAIQLDHINELNILSNVRLIHNHDLNPVTSTDNLRVQFSLSGEIKGAITCYLCLDGQELTGADKNVLFPLFTEAMNILVGRQISQDKELSRFKIQLSAPKISQLPVTISTSHRKLTQKYELELTNISFCVLTEYNLEVLN